jgi:hypothetical protein
METADRVRVNTQERINRRIDQETEACIREYAQRSPEDISRRIKELDREWDIERVLEINASALAFTGLLLGVAQNKRWLLLPSIVLPFLFQHAVQGWCPPVPLLRRLGVRTRQEIDREKYALKVLRGDFDKPRSLPRAETALQSVKA